MSKMGEDVSLLKRPITYGGILGAGGQLGKNAVTPEDAAFMQCVEAQTCRQTQKDGAAAATQAAAQENVKAGFVEKDAHSLVAEEGVLVQEILVPGVHVCLCVFLIDLSYVMMSFLNLCSFRRFQRPNSFNVVARKLNAVLGLHLDVSIFEV